MPMPGGLVGCMSLSVSGRFDTPGGVGSRSRALTILERVAEETIDAQQREEGSMPAKLAALFPDPERETRGIVVHACRHSALPKTR
jgi:hypothetical protein